MTDHIKRHVPGCKEVQFSDGSASQFKSKLPFLHVSETNTHGMERAYFGSRHGKGPCDALGWLVKKKAELYVKTRKGTIQHAKQLLEFCKENLTIDEGSNCEHKRRLFFYQEKIERSVSDKEVQTIKGTRKIHSVRGVEAGVIKTRHLSCFCHACLEEKGQCLNERFVGEWSTQYLFKGNIKSKHQTGRKGGKKPKQSDKTIGKKNMKQISDCTTFKELGDVVAGKTFEPLPQYTTKTFCNTGMCIDKNSMELVPKDIPQCLHPATVKTDGNCLPRSASVLAYGTEDHFKEMRERIVCEIVKNADLYLDDKYLKKGMNPNGNLDVAKTFAAYSSLYMGTRLNKKIIRKLYEQKHCLFVKMDPIWACGSWQALQTFFHAL